MEKNKEEILIQESLFQIAEDSNSILRGILKTLQQISDSDKFKKDANSKEVDLFGDLKKLRSKSTTLKQQNLLNSAELVLMQ